MPISFIVQDRDHWKYAEGVRIDYVRSRAELPMPSDEKEAEKVAEAARLLKKALPYRQVINH